MGEIGNSFMCMTFSCVDQAGKGGLNFSYSKGIFFICLKRTRKWLGTLTQGRESWHRESYMFWGLVLFEKLEKNRIGLVSLKRCLGSWDTSRSPSQLHHWIHLIRLWRVTSYVLLWHRASGPWAEHLNWIFRNWLMGELIRGGKNKE